MRDKGCLAPELSSRVARLARALVAAGRSWALYPPEHPAVRTSLERLTGAVREASGGQALSFGVTPETLLVEGLPVSTREGPTTEVASWLHHRDILHLSFLGEVPAAAIHDLLSLLAGDTASLRTRGGPAKVWADRGHPTILIEQIDFARVLEDRDVRQRAREKDDQWRAIVRAVLDRRKVLDENMQRRLLEIAGDVAAIGDLAHEVITPHHSLDGSPMLTTQAAAVVAAYRHLASIVEVMAPERRAEVMQNLVVATANMDPRIVLEMLRPAGQTGAVSTADASLRDELRAAFTDNNVANLIATTLSLENQASARLAEVFSALAPDESRKDRVLKLARDLLTDTAFGRTDQFGTVWSSVEDLLRTYNERQLDTAYRTRLDRIGERAEQMSRTVAPEMAALARTLDRENIRKLSVSLLVDLLKLERDPKRAPELARDVATLAEDLLLSGDYKNALVVVAALAEQAGDSASVARHDSRAMLDALPDTVAFREAADMLGEMDDAIVVPFLQVCRTIGPASVDALRDLFRVETETAAIKRARPLVLEFRARAVTRLAPLVSAGEWYTQRNAAALLGAIGLPDAVPLLQPLLRGSDPRVMRAAVQALANIDDPSAGRAIHTVLRAATGDHRFAVVGALVEERDPRVVPLLTRILLESDPLGADHDIVLETLTAIGEVGGDHAVPHVSQVMRRGSWFARKRTRAVKQSSVSALQRIGSPAAERALADAAGNGDRLLRKLVKAALTRPVANG